MLFSDFEYMHFSKIVAKSGRICRRFCDETLHILHFVCFLSGFVEEVKKAAVPVKGSIKRPGIGALVRRQRGSRPFVNDWTHIMRSNKKGAASQSVPLHTGLLVRHLVCTSFRDAPSLRRT
jgi:hypothetical protein